MSVCTTTSSEPPTPYFALKVPDSFDVSMTPRQVTMIGMRKSDVARAKRNAQKISRRRMVRTDRLNRLSMLSSLGMTRAMGLDDVNDPVGVSLDGYQVRYRLQALLARR
jgi:hypothetical protein